MESEAHRQGDAPTTTSPVGSLTSEILEQFRENLLKTGQFDEVFVRKLLALASSESKPKTKDFEALLQEEEPLE